MTNSIEEYEIKCAVLSWWISKIIENIDEMLNTKSHLKNPRLNLCLWLNNNRLG